MTVSMLSMLNCLTRTDHLYAHCNSLQKDYDKYVPKKMIYYSGTGKAQKKKEWKKVTIRSQVS